MPVDMNEVIKVLEVTAHSVRGCGLLSCAGSIDWAVNQIKKALELPKSTAKKLESRFSDTFEVTELGYELIGEKKPEE